MDFKVVRCLFEQSGTFKNAFIDLGFDAKDYDIRNDFHCTDVKLDLIAAMNAWYDGVSCIYDCFDSDDLIMCFYPCVRFENAALLWFQGNCFSLKNSSLKDKLNIALNYHNELSYLYSSLTKFVIKCLDRNLRLVIENPFSKQHYLYRYWPVKPAIIETDRSLNGDFYKKPTQYFFINCVPECTILNDAVSYNEQFDIYSNPVPNLDWTIARSMISCDYATRFIKQYLLTYDQIK